MNQRTLKKGSIVKVWHTNEKKSLRRGLDYVCVGCDEESKELILLKANSFNNNGTIHKAVTKPHVKLKYTDLNGIRIVKGISYASKQPRDISAWSDINRVLPQGVRSLNNLDEFICTPRG